MATQLTPSQLDKIQELYHQGLGSRKIALIIGVNRSTIQKSYQQLQLNSAAKKLPRLVSQYTEKYCKICGDLKKIELFRKRCNPKTQRISFESYCKECEYRKNNERLKRAAKILRQTNPNFVIRKSLSYFIWKSLAKSNSSKQDQSCLQFLPYTIEELRLHLESQFEPWMNWDNHGSYRKHSWNDNDSSTWSWQIDHIIPQSSLPYTTMLEDNFHKSWALSNLRPLSAKQNLLDGTSQIRHPR
jgi:hypothetical protein